MTPSSSGAPVRELVRMLTDGLPETVRSCLRDIEQDRRQLRGTTRNGHRVVVELAGGKRGTLLDTADPHGPGSGNVFNMLLHAEAGGSLPEACRLAERILGLKPGQWRLDPEREAQNRRDEERRRAEAVAAQERAVQRTARAFRAGAPLRPDSPGGKYFLTRCCWPSNGVASGLRDGTAWHSRAVGDCQAIIGQVVNACTGLLLGFRVTFLEAHMDGWRKLQAGTPKLSFGRVGCGVVEVLRGGSDLGLKEANERRLAEPLLIAEGIENVLSVAAEFPMVRAFATRAVGTFASLELPARFRWVGIVRDRDKPGNAGPGQAIAAAVRRWTDDGRYVAIFDPPPGFQDANDAARFFCRVG